MITAKNPSAKDEEMRFFGVFCSLGNTLMTKKPHLFLLYGPLGSWLVTPGLCVLLCFHYVISWCGVAGKEGEGI